MSTKTPVATVSGWIDEDASDIPKDMFLGWISEESGFRNDAPATSMGEVGFVQITPGEAREYGIDLSRVISDPRYSIQAGATLIRGYADKIRRLGYSDDSPAFWRLVKLGHTIGMGGVHALLSVAADQSVDPNDWGALEALWNSYPEKISKYSLPDRSKWFNLIDRVFSRGSLLAGIAVVSQPMIAVPLLLGIAVLLYFLFRGGRA